MDGTFIDSIRRVPSFGRAVLRNVTLEKEKRLVTVRIVTDRQIPDADRRKAEDIVREYVPEFFSCRADIAVRVPDAEDIKREIRAIASQKSVILSSTLEDGDIAVEEMPGGFSFRIALSPAVPSDGLAEHITERLMKEFCCAFSGECVTAEKKRAEPEPDDTVEERPYTIPARYFEIQGFSPIESRENPGKAMYICDLKTVMREVVICGTVTSSDEREYTTSAGIKKSYFQFVVQDPTGSVSLKYFARKKTIEHIRAIRMGESAVFTCRSEIYNGSLSVVAVNIDRGCPPRDFVPEKRKGRPAPPRYVTVKPAPYCEAAQTDMFGTENTAAESLKGREYVVFDIETTGIKTENPSGGEIDSIIEIGACRIRDCEICETFSSLINPARPLPDGIPELTGITDEMLEGQPTYEKVLPDFYKFCGDAALVGHNIVSFDFKFMDHYLSRLGYVLGNEIIDTLKMARETVFLPNYKLGTIGEYFGVSFRHHRALDDAVATAKIFMKLAKMQEERARR